MVSNRLEAFNIAYFAIVSPSIHAWYAFLEEATLHLLSIAIIALHLRGVLGGMCAGHANWRPGSTCLQEDRYRGLDAWITEVRLLPHNNCQQGRGQLH